ncbi:hypothetical protein B0H11DRAFT_685409 [Mycena galericulata]|nr:hypothetical protein B0H11DRAFT_685409 [Mycena galericulata]
MQWEPGGEDLSIYSLRGPAHFPSLLPLATSQSYHPAVGGVGWGGVETRETRGSSLRGGDISTRLSSRLLLVGVLEAEAEGAPPAFASRIPPTSCLPSPHLHPTPLRPPVPPTAIETPPTPLPPPPCRPHVDGRIHIICTHRYRTVDLDLIYPWVISYGCFVLSPGLGHGPRRGMCVCRAVVFLVVVLELARYIYTIQYEPSV